ncbi:MAG: type IVB secretion system apparatus protein IcmL/DotI [Gammaproteobacteria bacterium]|jgi:intracellular multiplication protein IcmL
MVHDALELVKLRSNFYRDSYRKVTMALLGAIIIIVALVGIVIFLIVSRPTPKYFATTDSGRIIPLIPLNQPNLSENNVLQWASQALVSIFSFDFLHYQRSFQESRKYFTTSGWNSFMEALSQAKTIQTVKDQRLIVSAVLNGAPIISNQYIIGGRYTWEAQIPLLISYQGTNSYSDNILATLKIQRVSTLDNQYGIGITEIVMQRGK